MKEYIIKKGNHSANGINLKFHCGLNVLRFSAKFGESCLYHLGNIDDNDINKLFGLVWGLTSDKNSFRIGWNCRRNNGKIQLYWYIHEKGITYPTANDDPEHAFLFEVNPNEIFDMRIEFHKLDNIIKIIQEWPDNIDVDLLHIDIPFNFNVSNCGYYNYPYFGGTSVATHDMKTYIQQL